MFSLSKEVLEGIKIKFKKVHAEMQNQGINRFKMQQLLIITHLKAYIKLISDEETRKARNFQFRASFLKNSSIVIKDLDLNLE